jgi:hypothetical protein
MCLENGGGRVSLRNQPVENTISIIRVDKIKEE